jgi:hypothetical protein
VRLFISSTPADFASERQHLMTQVLPGLRMWCENRRIHLIDVDLQWGTVRVATAGGGASTQQQDRDSLGMSMRELRRCREENVQPFFLSLLSDAYGKVISADAYPPGVAALLAELVGDGGAGDGADGSGDSADVASAGLSQAAVEVLCGAVASGNPNALFAMRRPHSAREAFAQPAAEGGAGGGGEGAARLQAMREAILARFPREQVLHYSAHCSARECSHECSHECSRASGTAAAEHTANPAAATAAAAPAQLGGLSAAGGFAETVGAFFRRRIARQYPEPLLGGVYGRTSGHQLLADAVSQERLPHLRFAAGRAEAVFGREDAQAQVLRYVAGGEQQAARLVARGRHFYTGRPNPAAAVRF